MENAKKFRIKRTSGKDVVFTGALIGSASTSAETARSDYSGVTGRWTVLSLYKTVGGKFVCHQFNGTQWQGERDTEEAKICDTEAEVFDFFGDDSLAKELYDDADLDFMEEIE